jgi:hypothetical protein
MCLVLLARTMLVLPLCFAIHSCTMPLLGLAVAAAAF